MQIIEIVSSGIKSITLLYVNVYLGF